MPSFIVLKPFIDKDTEDKFGVGSEYYTEDPERIQYLQSWSYLGEEVEKTDVNEDPEEGNPQIKHVGGGYYELPNGEKVKGKENALEELEKLQGSDE